MGLTEWMTSAVSKLNWSDISLSKISIMAFTLMVAKLWTPILSLEWYWYAAIFAIAAVKPMVKMFKK